MTPSFLDYPFFLLESGYGDRILHAVDTGSMSMAARRVRLAYEGSRRHA